MVNMFSQNIRKSLKYFLISKVCALTTVAFVQAPVYAQFFVSPLTIQTQEQRGKAEGIISISNRSNEAQRLRIEAQPFVYTRDAGLQTLTEKTPNDLTPYLQFSPRELTIQPGQTRKIRVIGRLAPNLPNGEYRAVIFNEGLISREGENNSQVNILSRVGVTFYVTKGNVSPRIEVSNANFNKKANQINLLVRNTGKASTVTKTSWTLRRDGKVITFGRDKEATINAETERNIELHNLGNKESNLKPGNYELSGELVWRGNKVPFNLNLTIPE